MTMNENKYRQAIDSFEPALSEEQLQATVKKIVKERYEQADRNEVKKLLYGLIDLTSLNGMDTEEHIATFTNSVNDFDGTDPTTPNVAAICVYPNMVKTVRETLTVPGVRVASVSGCFPASQSFTEVKVAETALAVADGADEIDIVLNLGKFMSEEYQEVCDEIEEQKAACRNAHLKVIIESGALKNPELIRRASILSLYSGGDFIKTSTGKEYPGASLEAAYVMCKVIKEYYDKHGERRGIKFSGGIRTSEQALMYYCIVKEVLGDEWLTPELFRIGASSLAKNLLADIR